MRKFLLKSLILPYPDAEGAIQYLNMRFTDEQASQKSALYVLYTIFQYIQKYIVYIIIKKIDTMVNL